MSRTESPSTDGYSALHGPVPDEFVVLVAGDEDGAGAVAVSVAVVCD